MFESSSHILCSSGVHGTRKKLVAEVRKEWQKELEVIHLLLSGVLEGEEESSLAFTNHIMIWRKRIGKM